MAKEYWPYNTRAWKDRTRPALLKANPLCQWIDPDTREQCKQPASVGHHLVDPRDDQTKAYDWANIVCVCPAHHPGGHRGDPGIAFYAATIEPGFLSQPERIHFHEPGLLPCWRKDYQKLPSLPSRCEALVSSVSQADLDRALAEPD